MHTVSKSYNFVLSSVTDREKDRLGFTKQERHDMVIEVMTNEINKNDKVFHIRWQNGHLFTTHILISTPVFWYKKFGWSRKDIETLMFKARVEIDFIFDDSLDRVFGRRGKGARWVEGIVVYPKDWNGAKEESKTEKKTLDADIDLIWNALTNNDSTIETIDCTTFCRNLKLSNIEISEEFANQLFQQLFANSTNNKNEINIDKKQLKELLATLDIMQELMPSDYKSLTDLDTCQSIMKEIMIALQDGQAYNADGIILSMNERNRAALLNKEAIETLNLLLDRETSGWEIRTKAIQMLADLCGNGIFQDEDFIRQLLCAIGAQLLDNKHLEDIQLKAIGIAPAIFHDCMINRENIALVMEHLDDILGNLFNILENPRCKINHAQAMKAVNFIVDDIISTENAKAILVLARFLSNRCNIENATSAKVRHLAMVNLQKIMFTEKSIYLSFDSAQVKAPIVDENELPVKGSSAREWLDMATYNQDSASLKLMSNNVKSVSVGSGGVVDDNKENYDDMKANLSLNKNSAIAEVGMTGIEIGNEFRDIVGDGLSHGIMDPNKANNIHCKKVCDIMQQLNPNYPSLCLDKDALQRYNDWKRGKLKPWQRKSMPTRKLPSRELKPIKLINMDSNTSLSTNLTPILPDI